MLPNNYSVRSTIDSPNSIRSNKKEKIIIIIINKKIKYKKLQTESQIAIDLKSVQKSSKPPTNAKHGIVRTLNRNNSWKSFYNKVPGHWRISKNCEKRQQKSTRSWRKKGLSETRIVIRDAASSASKRVCKAGDGPRSCSLMKNRCSLAAWKSS